MDSAAKNQLKLRTILQRHRHLVIARLLQALKDKSLTRCKMQDCRTTETLTGRHLFFASFFET